MEEQVKEHDGGIFISDLYASFDSFTNEEIDQVIC